MKLRVRLGFSLLILTSAISAQAAVSVPAIDYVAASLAKLLIAHPADKSLQISALDGSLAIIANLKNTSPCDENWTQFYIQLLSDGKEMAKDPGRMSWERSAKDEIADRVESDRNSFQSLIAAQEALLKEGKSAYGADARARGRALALEILEGVTSLLYGNVGKVDERNPDYIAFRADLNNTAAFLRESCDWDWKHALLHQGVLVPLNILSN